MTVNEAKAIIGSGLGRASKMPGWTFGLPARACILGSQLHKVEGTTCHSCYAFDRGFYQFRTVREAQERRLRQLTHPQWVDAFVTLLDAALPLSTAQRYFRWHDSGDLQSWRHLDNIVAVARRTPFYHHWLPTREYGIVNAWRFNTEGTFPDNLVIRLSAHLVDGELPTRLGEDYGVQVSGVHHREAPRGLVCEARHRGNHCGPCRACWDREVFAVSYPKH